MTADKEIKPEKQREQSEIDAPSSKPKGTSSPTEVVYKKPTFKNYKKHMKNRGGPNATPIQSIMGKSFKSLSVETKIKEYKIIKHWSEAVGPHIAKKTEPAKLIGSALHVKVATPAWITELMYQKEEIIDRLNREIGEDRIKEIFFKQGVLSQSVGDERDDSSKDTLIISDRDLSEEEEEQIEKETANIKDPKLKEILIRTMTKSFKKID